MDQSVCSQCESGGPLTTLFGFRFCDRCATKLRLQADGTILKNAEAFERTRLPDSLAVIGGGAIGVELAQSFHRLGVEVTVIEMLDRILAREEPELADRLARSLEAEGVRIITGRAVTRHPGPW